MNASAPTHSLPPGIVERPYGGPEDLPAIAALLSVCGAHRETDSLLRTLATVRPAERFSQGTPAVRLWVESTAGGEPPTRALACAMGGALNLRLHVHPEARIPAVEHRLMTWVREQRSSAAATRHKRIDVPLHPTLDHYLAELLDRNGFRRVEYVTHRYRRDLTGLLPDPDVPDGHRIRPLAGEHEVAAFVALFHDVYGAGPSVESRINRWRQDGHIPEIVVEAPDGALVAFCYLELGSFMLPLNPGEGCVAQFGATRALPYHEFTAPAVRAGLHELRARGATIAKAQCGSTNEKEIPLLTAEGFELYETLPRLRYSLPATTAA